MNLLEEDNLSTKDKRLEFILFPKCPLFGGLTVVPSADTYVCIESLVVELLFSVKFLNIAMILAPHYFVHNDIGYCEVQGSYLRKGILCDTFWQELHLFFQRYYMKRVSLLIAVLNAPGLLKAGTVLI